MGVLYSRQRRYLTCGDIGENHAPGKTCTLKKVKCEIRNRELHVEEVVIIWPLANPKEAMCQLFKTKVKS